MISCSIGNEDSYQTLNRRFLLRNQDEFPIKPTELGDYDLIPKGDLSIVRHNVTHLVNYCSRYPWFVDHALITSVARMSLGDLSVILNCEGLTETEEDIAITLYYLAERVLQFSELDTDDLIHDLEVSEIFDVFEGISNVNESSRNFVTACQIRTDLEAIQQAKLESFVKDPNDSTLMMHLDSLSEFHRRRIVDPMYQEVYKIRSLIRRKEYTSSDLRKDLSSLMGDLKMTETGFTSADIFLHLLFGQLMLPRRFGEMPKNASGLEPLEVHRFIAAMDMIEPTSNDSFFDYGSGIGNQAILARLLYGIPSGGVELVQEFHNLAKQSAHDLKLDNINFHNQDAADIDPPDASIFLLFNPFNGSILSKVILKLAELRKRKDFHIISASSSNRILRNVPFFKEIKLHDGGELDIALFRSVR